MSVFKNYALYYDLFYKDKDYESEAEYVYNLLKQLTSNLETVLELGCGTGKHAELFAKKELSVHGIDLSQLMLDKAKKRQQTMPENLSKQLEFTQGNICEIRLNKKFDAVVALFHVVSYQTTNEALEATFLTVKEHLKPGGIFLFDVWYGPAVLTERPERREKCLNNKVVEIKRIAEPVIYPNDNIVDVKYKIHMKDLSTNQTEEINETHKMRYLFKPEILSLMKQSGFKFIKSEEWLTSKEPGFDTWSVCFICSRI